MIDLNSLLTGQSTGGTWGITSICGDSATNPDTVDLTDPTNVDFSGKALGTYTFYYSVSQAGCTNECTAVTVEAIDCCDVTINSVTITPACPYTITINYTTNSTAQYLYVVLRDNLFASQYRRQLDSTMSAIGTHTLTITDIPCLDTTQQWTVQLCCTNQAQIST